MGQAKARKKTDPNYGKPSTGLARVIEIAKGVGLVEQRCACGTCDNIGYASGDDCCVRCGIEMYKALKAALLAEGFVRNARTLDDVIASQNSQQPLFFLPRSE